MTMTNAEEDDGWRVISTGWQTSYDRVSWAYSPPPPNPRDCKPKSRTQRRPGPHRFVGLGLAPLTKARTETNTDPQVDATELELNPDLVGVKTACDSLSEYEKNVGFGFVSDILSGAPGGLSTTATPTVPNLSRTIEEEEVLVGRKQWEELVRGLFAEATVDAAALAAAVSSTSDHDSDASSISIPGSNHSTTTTLSSLDLAEWDHVLSTPKPSYPVTARTRSCSTSPSPSLIGDSPSNLNKLNVFASSFTPGRTAIPLLTFSSDSSPKTTASSPSPPLLNDFVFPPPPAPLVFPKVKLEKDEQGFFTGVEEEEATPKSRCSSSLLPAFLQEEGARRRPCSKTRAIVDRLRSTSQRRGGVVSRESSSLSPSPSPLDQQALLLYQRNAASDDDSSSSRQSRGFTRSPASVGAVDDGEGWIGLGDMQSSEVNQPAVANDSAKAQRRRDLFMALTKHNRSESSNNHVSPSVSVAVELQQSEQQSEGEGGSPKTTHSSLRALSISSTNSSSSMPPTPGTSCDGWIEGLALVGPQNLNQGEAQLQTQVQSQGKRNQSAWSHCHKKRNSSSVDNKANVQAALSYPSLNTPATIAAATTRPVPPHHPPHPHHHHHNHHARPHNSHPPSSFVYGYPPVVAPVPMGYPPYAMMPYPMHAHQPQAPHHHQHQRVRSGAVPGVPLPPPPMGGYVPAGAGGVGVGVSPFGVVAPGHGHPHPQMVPGFGVPAVGVGAVRPGLVSQW